MPAKSPFAQLYEEAVKLDVDEEVEAEVEADGALSSTVAPKDLAKIAAAPHDIEKLRVYLEVSTVCGCVVEGTVLHPCRTLAFSAFYLQMCPRAGDDHACGCRDGVFRTHVLRNTSAIGCSFSRTGVYETQWTMA